MDDPAIRADPYPAGTKRTAGAVDGVHTDVMVVSFADKIVITITQEGRLAQWFHVPLDAVHRFNAELATRDEDDALLPLTHLTPTTLLGGAHQEREATGQLVAVQLASAISMRNKDEGRSVLCGLGLKAVELEQMGFMELIELVGRCL